MNNYTIYWGKISIANNGKLTYQLNKSRNIVLLKFFIIDIQLYKDQVEREE